MSEKTNKEIKLYYACCPYCKTVLVQAQNGMDGYLDGQPIRIRGRHYNRVACYDTVYIVSNLSLKEQYTNIQQNEPKTWAAFCRRITAVYNFDLSKEIPVSKITGELKKPLSVVPIDDDGDIPF